MAIVVLLLLLAHSENGLRETDESPAEARQPENDPEIAGMLLKLVTQPSDFKDAEKGIANGDGVNGDAAGDADSMSAENGKLKDSTGVVPGLVAASQQYGKPIRIGAAGVRQWKSEKPIAANDLVHIGSCTKAMTATMIGRLIDRNKLTFETTIRNGLPHLVDRIHPDYHDVTLRQLLMHRGGVPRDAQWQNHADKKITKCRELIVIDALAGKPAKQPDNSFEYSNLGYVVAALMASHVEKKTWEQLMQGEIFDVLEMHSAGFGPPGAKGTGQQPWGHLAFATGAMAERFDNPPALGPAGTVHLKMSDWFKFAFEHAGCSDNPIVSPETLRVLHAGPITKDQEDSESSEEHYSCGWLVASRPWARGRVLTHAGSNTRWTCAIWIAPETRSVYAAVCNAGTGTHIHGIVDQAISGLIQLDR